MLKKIPLSQLQMGMHLHKLEGRWLEHPLWKTRFVIDKADELQRLLACGVAECWIDDALGREPETASAAAKSEEREPAAATPSKASARAALAEGSAMGAELRRAAAICQRGRDAVTALFSEARLGRSVDAEGCLPLVNEVADSVARNAGALVSLARLKSRDDYSYMHSVAVCALMVALGRQLGLDADGCRQAGLAGLMHDIGKAMVPVELLNKPGRLTPQEYAIVQQHPLQGHALLVDGKGSTQQTLDVVLHHHERIDGEGYPHRLSGVALSQMARMGAICDVYDAVTSSRPYKQAWDPAESIARMASWKGQFDDTVFAAFVQTLGIYPTGSVVRLESHRLAVVAEQNPGKLVAPVVQVFYSLRSQMRVSPQRLDLSQPGCTDRIVGRHETGSAGFGSLDGLWLAPDLLRRTGV